MKKTSDRLRPRYSKRREHKFFVFKASPQSETASLLVFLCCFLITARLSKRGSIWCKFLLDIPGQEPHLLVLQRNNRPASKIWSKSCSCASAASKSQNCFSRTCGTCKRNEFDIRVHEGRQWQKPVRRSSARYRTLSVFFYGFQGVCGFTIFCKYRMSAFTSVYGEKLIGSRFFNPKDFAGTPTSL